MKSVMLVLSLVVVIAAGVTLANLSRDPDAFDIDWSWQKNLPKKKASVESPKRAEIIQTITAPGTIELVEEANIASELVGKVVSVHVEEGDRVKAGDLLVKLDDTAAKARLDSARARIKRLRSAIEVSTADLRKAERDSEGFEKLAQRGFSTPTELADSRTLVAKMKATLEMSRHELNESEAAERNSLQELDRTEIRAPTDGLVIGLDVEVGEVVIAGTTNLPGTVLMSVGDPSRKQVRVEVDETDVLLVRSGQPAKIYLHADQLQPVPGIVDLIAPKGTKLAEVVTFETLVLVEGDHESLRAGMNSTVEIEVERRTDALSVPVQAVVHRRLKDLPDTAIFRQWAERQARTPGEKARSVESRYVKIVFVVQDQVARARPVETGISDERRIEIVSGLAASDQVVVGPFRVLDELSDDQPIEIEKPEKKNAQGNSDE